MILDALDNAARYAAVHPAFGKAFEFLRRGRMAETQPGRHEIDGDAVYALASRGPGKGDSGAKLEAHRKYIDIQYVVSGADRIGWRGVRTCRAAGAYDSARDIQFFDDPPDAWIDVPAGAFAVFFPHDAHAPLAGKGEVAKIVVKVAV